jgi:hypothetical protein
MYYICYKEYKHNIFIEILSIARLLLIIQFKPLLMIIGGYFLHQEKQLRP